MKELKLNQIWDGDKLNNLSQFIISESQKQSEERKLKNELLSIQFQMEEAAVPERKDMDYDKVRAIGLRQLVKSILDDCKLDADAIEESDPEFIGYIADSRKNKKEKLNSEKYLELQSYFEQIKAASTEEEIKLISEKVFVQQSKAIICNPKLKLILVDLEEMLIAKSKEIITKNRCKI